jgi:hypothetical protein
MQQEFQQNIVKRRVSYFYDPDIGNYHYGQGHPMKVSDSLSSSICFLISSFFTAS